MRELRFVKMHGLGNDFVLADCRDSELPSLADLAQRLCHRRFGIGADQLLLLSSSKKADFRMRVFNADGSEVEMCGNGIRCLAKYVWDRGLSAKNILGIETAAGIMRPEKVDGLVKVDMGEPILDPGRIPVGSLQGPLPGATSLVNYPLLIGDREFRITCVSMGNPHAVIVVDNVPEFPVAYYGPMIENHALFPKRTNVEFIEVENRAELRMRVWERGAGETMACGTGASASAVAGHILGLSERSVTVHLTGGDLAIDWAADNHVYMTGPAVEVFSGVITL